MSNYKFVRVQLIFLATVLVGLLPTIAAAQALTIQLTATEVFDPYNILGNGSVGTFVNSGTLTCPGGQLTSDPMQPCSPGSRMHFRGVSWESRVMSSSELLAGRFYNEGNNNFDAGATGRVWGTFKLELDEGGVWEGSYTAERSKAEDVTVSCLACCREIDMQHTLTANLEITSKGPGQFVVNRISLSVQFLRDLLPAYFDFVFIFSG